MVLCGISLGRGTFLALGPHGQPSKGHVPEVKVDGATEKAAIIVQSVTSHTYESQLFRHTQPTPLCILASKGHDQ